MLAEIDANRAQVGTVRAEAWLAVARTALLLADTPVAADAVKRRRSDTELNPATDAWLDSRVAQVEGELLRAQGDLARSRDLLAQRVALLATSPDSAVPVIWQARLDLACTLVLLRDPGAPAALQQAARARPPQIPPGRPLDAVQAWLQALWQSERGEGASAVQTARIAVERAYGREAGRTAALPAGRGVLAVGLRRLAVVLQVDGHVPAGMQHPPDIDAVLVFHVEHKVWVARTAPAAKTRQVQLVRVARRARGRRSPNVLVGSFERLHKADGRMRRFDEVVVNDVENIDIGALAPCQALLALHARRLAMDLGLARWRSASK